MGLQLKILVLLPSSIQINQMLEIVLACQIGVQLLVHLPQLQNRFFRHQILRQHLLFHQSPTHSQITYMDRPYNTYMHQQQAAPHQVQQQASHPQQPQQPQQPAQQPVQQQQAHQPVQQNQYYQQYQQYAQTAGTYGQYYQQQGYQQQQQPAQAPPQQQQQQPASAPPAGPPQGMPAGGYRLN